MDAHKAIQSQYLSALAMLRQAIVKCPAAMRDASQDADPAWYRAYHTLYWAHKYLQVTSKDFVPWKNHPKNPDRSKPLSKQELLEYLEFVERQVATCVPAADLQAGSGFYGFPSSKLEMHIYNIRHIQQHTGERYERLGAHRDIKLSWMGTTHREIE